jgi:ribosome-interacting GTPase 1
VDKYQATQNLKELKSCVGIKTKVIPVSCMNKIGLEALGREMFNILGIIRIYTKEPNKREASPKPFTLKNESTVLDLAKEIHSDFFKRFSYARIWSPRLPFSPSKVGSSFILKDKDVVELHVK